MRRRSYIESIKKYMYMVVECRMNSYSLRSQKRNNFFSHEAHVPIEMEAIYGTLKPGE